MTFNLSLGGLECPKIENLRLRQQLAVTYRYRYIHDFNSYLILDLIICSASNRPTLELSRINEDFGCNGNLDNCAWVMVIDPARRSDLSNRGGHEPWPFFRN